MAMARRIWLLKSDAMQLTLSLIPLELTINLQKFVAAATVHVTCVLRQHQAIQHQPIPSWTKYNGTRKRRQTWWRSCELNASLVAATSLT